jgi:AraC family transcriptional regulator
MAHEPTPLEPGCFYGQNRTERRVDGLILSETHYRPAQTVPPHIHQRAYFGFLLGGSYWEQLGKRAVTCDPLSVVFHPPREVRRGAISSLGARLFHVELPDAWFERSREVGPFPDGALDHHAGPLVTQARALYREFRQPDPVSPLMIEGVVLEMMASLLRSGRPRDDGAPWLRRARELLIERATDPLDLSALADETGVAPVRLARAYRRRYHETPGETIRRERVRRACVLLAGERTLASIASELGFADQSHFTRVFRGVVGLTPGAWRRERQASTRR